MADAPQKNPPEPPEDNLPVVTLDEVIPTKDKPRLCETRDMIFATAKAVLRIFHPHPVKLVDMTKFHAFKHGRFQCDLCGNVSTGFSFHCFKCGYDCCEGCSALLTGWDDARDLQPCSPEEMTRRFGHLHPHPVAMTVLEGLEGYGDEGRYFCDRCHRRDKGSSIHCKECGFDLCMLCNTKIIGTFKVKPHCREGAGVVNDMKHKAIVRTRAECGACRSPCIVGKEHRWMRCNECPDFDMCWQCFQDNRDLTLPPGAEGTPHPKDHTFTDMMQLLTLVMREAKERSEKSALENQRNAEKLKIVPFERDEYKLPVVSVAFCPNCGAAFDIHNPHNPRNHPDPAIDPNCKFTLPIMENGGPLSDEDQEAYKCCICRKIIKAYLPVVAPLCRHAFCADCILTSLKDHQRCPVDGKPLRVEHLCKWPWMQNKIQNLEVTCINNAGGCNAMVSVRDFAMHTEKCEHTLEACKYREVGCYFVAPSAFLREQHIPKCVFQQLAPYIRRNELNKKEISKDISTLKDEIRAAREQLDLLLQEKDFCYSSSIFEVDEDAVQAQRTGNNAKITTTRNEEEILSQQKAITAAYNTLESKDELGPRLNWDVDKCDPDICVFSNTSRTVTCKETYIVIADVPVTKDSEHIWWEVRIDTYPGVGSIRVGIAQMPVMISKATKLLNRKQHLGEDGLSFGWLSTGSVMTDGKFLCQNEDKLRYDNGDYLGFYYRKDLGEMHLFRNRVWAQKLGKLFRIYVDPVTKRQTTPQWFPAVSIAYLHYQCTLLANGPQMPIPAAHLKDTAKPAAAPGAEKKEESGEKKKETPK